MSIASMVGVIALLILGANTSGSTASSTGPPFHGVVAPSSSVMTSGCAKVRTIHPWSFQLKTGTAIASSTGVAPSCSGTTSGRGLQNNAQDTGAVQVAIPLSGISNLTSSVQTNLSWKFTLSLNSSDGFANGKSAPCKAPLFSYDYRSTDHAWGYNASTGLFAAQNSSSVDRVNHYRSISVSGPPIPKPFVLNNTTAYSFAHSFGGYRGCDAQSAGYIGAQAFLIDRTTGMALASTANTVDSVYGTIVEAFVQVANVTDWSCYSSVQWYGPSNYSASNPLSCTSYNATTFSYFFDFPPLGLTNTSTNNTQPWSGSLSGSGGFWWNSSASPTFFATSDRYYLQLTLSATLEATNNWPAGSAAWKFNMATLGNDMKLTSVSIS